MRSLKTPDRRIAIPRALLLASQVLTLFAELQAMPDDQRQGMRIDFGLELSLDELGLPKIKNQDLDLSPFDGRHHRGAVASYPRARACGARSEEHTSELQSPLNL